MDNKEAETIVDADPMAPSPSGEEPEKSENKAIEGVETNVSSDASRPKRSKQAKPIRPFPQYTIEDAICVPKVIGAQNAGKPWPVEHVASALNTSKNTNSFFYLTSASRDYGFTTGTSRAKTIELTALGRKIVFPESQIDEAQAFSEAFNNIDLFKKVNDNLKVRVNTNVYRGNHDKLFNLLAFLTDLNDCCDEIRVSNLIFKDSFSVNNINSQESVDRIMSDEEYIKLFNDIQEYYEWRGFPIIVNKKALGFVEYAAIMTTPIIIMNKNIDSDVSKQICENSIEEKKIHTFKCLVSGDISLSWNTDNIIM